MSADGHTEQLGQRVTTAGRVMVLLPGAVMRYHGCTGAFGPNDRLSAVVDLAVGTITKLSTLTPDGLVLPGRDAHWTIAAQQLARRLAKWQLARAEEWRKP